MDPAMGTVLNTLKLDDELFTRAVAGLDDETARRRIADNVSRKRRLP